MSLRSDLASEKTRMAHADAIEMLGCHAGAMGQVAPSMIIIMMITVIL